MSSGKIGNIATIGYNADMTDSRLQVELNRDVLAILDALMIETRRIEGNRKIGSGTVAARLLESLAAHPDLIQQLLDEYSQRQGADAVVIAEPAPPFPATRNVATKRKKAA